MSSSTRKPNCLKSELLAHRALRSADVVVAREGKNASARSSSARRRAITDARSSRCDD
jgi:hypothetical protein